MKLSGTTLIMADFFTPFNENALACNDWDAGSGSPVLLPPSAGSLAVPNLMLAGTKEGDLSSTDSVQGRIHLIQPDKMGKDRTTPAHNVHRPKRTVNQP